MPKLRKYKKRNIRKYICSQCLHEFYGENTYKDHFNKKKPCDNVLYHRKLEDFCNNSIFNYQRYLANTIRII